MRHLLHIPTLRKLSRENYIYLDTSVIPLLDLVKDYKYIKLIGDSKFDFVYRYTSNNGRGHVLLGINSMKEFMWVEEDANETV